MKTECFTVGPETVRMLELGHPWVIADRYTRKWPVGRAGDLVRLCDEKENFLATALLDPGERVVARVLELGPMRLDRAWVQAKVARAAALRSAHADLEGTSAFRLVNGEGDGLPGLTVDRYNDHLMVQLYSAAWRPHLSSVTEALLQVLSPAGIYEKFRPQQTRALGVEESREYSRLLWGAAAPERLTVRENDLNFLVELEEGLNTGLFLDQRGNRRDLMKRMPGKKFLNLFSYTGAFSVAAAASGAGRVTSVDASTSYLDWAQENFGANRLNPRRHEFIVGDCFEVLDDLRRQERLFDLVLMDPPTFSTTAKSRFTTRRRHLGPGCCRPALCSLPGGCSSPPPTIRRSTSPITSRSCAAGPCSRAWS